ncbi:hypothetical protein RHGRI_029454 [Rhododendron griersonianum]|uniref:Uncharacterized protein n=1 Tax=Rhododendron griersonianum TaxID=479676 RepID=A0AAV6IKB1_9ERIC|nr:hypothetical protein RHGRI_029454 [Rhododendron griersonianum]
MPSPLLSTFARSAGACSICLPECQFCRQQRRWHRDLGYHCRRTWPARSSEGQRCYRIEDPS